MYAYTVTQWLFLFYFYCFFGWCFESAYVSFLKKRLVNRGFLRGPFLPLYGTGACMMLVVSRPFGDNLFLTFLAGCIGATVLEYITGVLMEALFKVRYWDYSSQKFNFQGQICLSSTLAWGGLTILMTRVLHRPVEYMMLQLPGKTAMILTFMVTIVIAADFALSFKAAIDLRDILVGMERVKEEMERMQKRLDVIIAVAGEEFENRKEAGGKRMEEMILILEERFAGLKEKVKSGSSLYSENIKEEIAELIIRFRVYQEYRNRMKSLKDFYKRQMIKGNPGMVSKKFKDALEELKEAVDSRFKK